MFEFGPALRRIAAFRRTGNVINGISHDLWKNGYVVNVIYVRFIRVYGTVVDTVSKY